MESLIFTNLLLFYFHFCTPLHSYLLFSSLPFQDPTDATPPKLLNFEQFSIVHKKLTEFGDFTTPGGPDEPDQSSRYFLTLYLLSLTSSPLILFFYFILFYFFDSSSRLCRMQTSSSHSSLPSLLSTLPSIPLLLFMLCLVRSRMHRQRKNARYAWREMPHWYYPAATHSVNNALIYGMLSPSFALHPLFFSAVSYFVSPLPPSQHERSKREAPSFHHPPLSALFPPFFSCPPLSLSSSLVLTNLQHQEE